MSAVHAPGPWEMAGPVGRAVWIQSEARSNIAAVHGAYTDEGLANARLIASAPELLEIVRELCAYAGGMEYDTYRSFVKRADEVLAKAEGRS